MKQFFKKHQKEKATIITSLILSIAAMINAIKQPTMQTLEYQLNFATFALTLFLAAYLTVKITMED